MEITGLAPQGTYDVGEALTVAADALVEGGQTKVSVNTSFEVMSG
jgi:Sterol methyltransferase C-terminal